MLAAAAAAQPYTPAPASAPVATASCCCCCWLCCQPSFPGKKSSSHAPCLAAPQAHLKGRVVGQLRARRERIIPAAAVGRHVRLLWLGRQPCTHGAGRLMVRSRGRATRRAHTQRLHCSSEEDEGRVARGRRERQQTLHAAAGWAETCSASWRNGIARCHCSFAIWQVHRQQQQQHSRQVGARLAPAPHPPPHRPPSWWTWSANG